MGAQFNVLPLGATDLVAPLWKRDKFSRAVSEGVVCVCMSVVDGSVTSLAVLSVRASFVSVCLL